MNAQPIRLVLIGAAGDHEAYQKVAERLRRASLSADVFTSVEKALEKNDSFDAAIVRTPVDTRAAAECRLAEAGKHVLVEAPIAAVGAEAERAVAVAAKKNVTLMVGGTLRFLPGNEPILPSRADNKLGAPGLLRVHRWSSGGSSGGSIGERIAGDVDLALHIFDGSPTRVYALQREPAYLQVHFGFDGGGMAVLDFARGLPEGQNYHSLHVIGATGAAYADDHHNTHLVFRGGDAAARIAEQGTYHIAREVQAFVDAIVDGRPPAVTGEHACDVLRIVEAVLGSLEAGKPLHRGADTYEVPA